MKDVILYDEVDAAQKRHRTPYHSRLLFEYIGKLQGLTFWDRDGEPMQFKTKERVTCEVVTFWSKARMHILQHDFTSGWYTPFDLGEPLFTILDRIEAMPEPNERQWDCALLDLCAAEDTWVSLVRDGTEANI